MMTKSFTSMYNRLSSSSSHSDLRQPLLGDSYHNNKKECLEQLKLEIEANGKKTETLERKNAALERELGELRAAIFSKQVSPSAERNTATMEREIRELKHAVSMLESKSYPTLIPGTSGTESDVALKKEIEKLAHRLMQLELESLMSVRKQDVEKLIEKNAELENSIVELITTINQLKSTPPQVDTHLTSPMEPELRIQGNETSTLVNCLIVLIFLVAVLIGVSL